MRPELLVLAISLSAAHAEEPHFWEFPNFSDRVQIRVWNTEDVSSDGLAIVRLSEVRKAAPEFPGTLALATDDAAPAHALETESDPDRNEFAIRVQLQPRQERTIFVYYSTTLRNTLPVVARTHASHSYGYNRATAALESELIGYRTYGAFALDVQAHARGEQGLFDELFGFASVHQPLSAGHDTVHTGNTLGLGGLFVRSGGDVYRPPFSTPDYTHLAPRRSEPSYRVIASGPLRAIIEEDLREWELGNDSVAVRAEYEIDAGQEVVHCHWWVTPLHMSRIFEIGAGIRDLDPGHVRDSGASVVTFGTQEASDGPIALGIAYTKNTTRAGTLATQEVGNQIVVFPQRLTAGKAVEGDYTAGAAWSGSGWSDPQGHLLDVLASQAARPMATVIRNERNPHPEGLEREPK
jgi:hypothetical protein